MEVPAEESDELSDGTLVWLEELVTHPTRPKDAVRQRRRAILLFFILDIV